MANPPELEVFLKVAALVSLLALGGGQRATVLLDGTAQPCADVKESTSGVPRVHVYAFDAAKIPSIRKSLDVLDSLDWENGDPDAIRAASIEYNRLYARVQKTKKIGYAMSDGNGNFEINVEPIDSVLVFGEAKMPGEPFYYSSRVVPAVGDKDEVRVILLMCNQQLL